MFLGLDTRLGWRQCVGVHSYMCQPGHISTGKNWILHRGSPAGGVTWNGRHLSTHSTYAVISREIIQRHLHWHLNGRRRLGTRSDEIILKDVFKMHPAGCVTRRDCHLCVPTRTRQYVRERLPDNICSGRLTEICIWEPSQMKSQTKSRFFICQFVSGEINHLNCSA